MGHIRFLSPFKCQKGYHLKSFKTVTMFDNKFIYKYINNSCLFQDCAAKFLPLLPEIEMSYKHRFENKVY